MATNQTESGFRKKAKVFWNNPNLKFWVAPFLLLLSLTYSYFNSHDPHLFHRLISIGEHLLKFGTPLCILAIGASLVVSTGGVDISSSGVATLTGISVAILYKLGFTVHMAVAISLPIGIVSGFLLGGAVTKLHSPPMVLSWAWGLVLMIFAIQYSTGHLLQFPDADSLTSSISTHAIKYEPKFVLIASAIVMVFTMYVVYSGITRRACAVGANRDAAIYSGIRADRTVIWSYVISGLCSSISGVMWFYFKSGEANTTTFFGNELIPLAIALLGGTVLSGGYLNLASVVAAAFFWANLKLIEVNVKTDNVPEEWQPYFTQLIFSIIVILISTILGKKLKGETITIHTEQKISNN